MLIKQVIINADDFGRTTAINSAVIQAHRQGVLTSTSLMVTGDACQEAVELARATPTLAVGLHLVVCNGRAALPHKEIPHLVDGSGRFSDNPLRSGLLYGFSRTARAELGRELTAQFERFAATGLSLSHVDGHMHLHVHPMVFNLLLPLVEDYGAHGLRLPRDELTQALRYNNQQAVTKIAWAVALGLVSRWCLRHINGRRWRDHRLTDQHLSVPQQVYGVMQTGQMRQDYVVKVLRHLRSPSAEIYFHPSTVLHRDALGPNPGDLETLLSPTIRQVITECGLHLATYPSLEEVR